MTVKPVNLNNFERAMGYVVGKRNGYIRELKPFGNDAINMMKTIGLLKTGYTTEAETYGATKLLRKHYIAIYGKTEYFKQIIKGLKNRLKAQ